MKSSLTFCLLLTKIEYFLFLSQVRQWIAGRGTSSSTPSTSRTPSPPPASSSVDCKHTLPSHQSSSGASQSDQTLSHRPRSEKHTDMAELAKHVS